jgi:tripartite-type tricarboxylate transporter receptor subunit TctC
MTPRSRSARRLSTGTALAILFGAALTALAPLPAAAQTFPSKPVKLVIPFPPGGSLDNVGRLIAQKLSEAWGQQVVIENKPGAGGNIGADAVAKSPPDGYTVVMGALSTHAVNPSLYRTMPYDAAKDFAPISNVAITPNVLIVSVKSPIHTLPELIAYAKANPGKVNFGSGSNGSAGHLAGELFKIDTGTDVMHIPYQGGGPAMIDLMAGRIDINVVSNSSTAAQVAQGKLRPIAVTSAKCWPRKALIKKPGVVDVSIGKPIPSQGRQAGELMAEVQAWIESEMRRLDPEAYPPAKPAP